MKTSAVNAAPTPLASASTAMTDRVAAQPTSDLAPQPASDLGLKGAGIAGAASLKSALEQSIPWKSLQLPDLVASPTSFWAVASRQMLLGIDIKPDSQVAFVGQGAGVTSAFLVRERPEIRLMVATDRDPEANNAAALNAIKILTSQKDQERLVQSIHPRDLLDGYYNHPLIKKLDEAKKDPDVIVASLPQFPNFTPYSDRTKSFAGLIMGRSDDEYVDRAALTNFGLALNYRFLEEASRCLKPDGRIALVIGTRAPDDLINEMFTRNGFVITNRQETIVPVQSGNYLKTCAIMEFKTGSEGRHMTFYRDSPEGPKISASDAIDARTDGHRIFEGVAVIEARVRQLKS